MPRRPHDAPQPLPTPEPRTSDKRTKRRKPHDTRSGQMLSGVRDDSECAPAPERQSVPPKRGGALLHQAATDVMPIYANGSSST
jgi:hypothetical protein